MKTKKTMIIAAFTIGLLVGIIIYAVSSTEKDFDPVADIISSIEVKDGQLHFRIPDDFKKPEKLNIFVSGRAEYEDGFSTSLHFFEVENETDAWKGGQAYIVELDSSYTDLLMDISYENKDGTITEQMLDLMELVGENLPTTAVDEDLFPAEFAQKYPEWELLDYTRGKEENSLAVVALAREQNEESPVTLLAIDENGVGQQLVPAAGKRTEYRLEDGLIFEENVVRFSLDVWEEDGTQEIHDYEITITYSEVEGVRGIEWKNEETLRQ